MESRNSNGGTYGKHPSKGFRILTLDGGGSKGFFTLGVLERLEAFLENHRLADEFDLIYGTSTGSIIAACLATGMSVAQVRSHYEDFVPQVLGRFRVRRRSTALQECLRKVFGTLNFSNLQTDIGIVTANLETKEPTIFKSKVAMAHGSKDSFLPGFGSSLADGVRASCSAYPFFNPVEIETPNHGQLRLIDGGFVANDPTFFALLDAKKAFQVPDQCIRILSVGVGKYQHKLPFLTGLRHLNHFWSRRLMDDMFSFSSNTLSTMFRLYSVDIQSVRLNPQADTGIATSLFETNYATLGRLRQFGHEEFTRRECDLKTLLRT